MMGKTQKHYSKETKQSIVFVVFLLFAFCLLFFANREHIYNNFAHVVVDRSGSGGGNEQKDGTNVETKVDSGLVNKVDDGIDSKVERNSDDFLDLFRKRKRKCSAKEITLLWSHVPKAGGRSFVSTFYKIRKIWQPLYNRVGKNPHKLTFGITIAVGHYHLEEAARRARHVFNKDGEIVPMPSAYTSRKFSKKTPLDCLYSTFFLRHPVSRMQSAYYTSVGGRWLPSGNAAKISGPSIVTHWRCKNPPTKSQSLVEWTEKGLEHMHHDCPLMSNMMARYLAFDIGHKVPNTGLPLDSPKMQSWLKVAKLRLKKLDFFGLTEYFDDSMRLFSYTLGLGPKMKEYAPVFNLNSYDHSLPDEARKKLEEFNALDIKLYEYAKELFLKRVEEMNFKGNEPAFVCDKDSIICWDKHTNVLFNSSSKGHKSQDSLCGYVGHCTRNFN